MLALTEQSMTNFQSIRWPNTFTDGKAAALDTPVKGRNLRISASQCELEYIPIDKPPPNGAYDTL